MLVIDIIRTLAGVAFFVPVWFILRKKPHYMTKLDPRVWWTHAKKLNRKSMTTALRILPFLCLTIVFLALFLPVVNGVVEYATRTPSITPSDNVVTTIAEISPILFGLALVFLPVLEEWLFRGVLLEEFRQRWGVNKAVVFSTLLFAGIHLTNAGYGLQSVFVPLFAGFIFATMYLKGGLKLATATHSIYNFVQFLMWCFV